MFRLCLCVLLVIVGCDDNVRVGSDENLLWQDEFNGNTLDQSNSLQRPSSYTLVWQDEFDSGAKPDAIKWQFEIGDKIIGGTVWGNSERQYYTDSVSNAYIEDGKLVIQVKDEIHHEARPDHKILATSARITTNTDHYFAAIGDTPYGFYEFRARLHCIRGSWPALWLLGRDGTWPEQGEIDVVEWSGKYHNQTVASSAYHTKQTHEEKMVSWKTHTLSDMCTTDHLFQLHWTKNAIIMGIDGKETLRFTRQPSHTKREWPFDQPAFIIMNIAVGGNLGGDVNRADISKMKLEVDYVRVWQDPNS